MYPSAKLNKASSLYRRHHQPDYLSVRLDLGWSIKCTLTSLGIDTQIHEREGGDYVKCGLTRSRDNVYIGSTGDYQSTWIEHRALWKLNIKNHALK